MTSLPKAGASTTASTQPTQPFQEAQLLPPRLPSASTGRSVLTTGPTVVVRAVRGPSVTIPFDVNREVVRRENREANQSDRDQSATTDTSR